MAYEYVPLKEKFETEIIPAMTKEFGYKNKLEVPRVSKIVVNMGIGEGSRNADLLEIHARELTSITGQKPVITKAKRSIANFKLRDGMPVGLKLTLRGARMYNFLYKLVNVVLPKLRDFRGVDPDSFDGRGNYAMGLPEQLVFPEIVPDQIKRVQGMDIIVVTTARTDEEARSLLGLLGIPFKRVMV